ncbi:MAG: pyridoxine 5'-phosphate synthase [Deltaproteobacteria bacterium]|nr:pyridoxine 5'-phosphate synthase [Deltaproteobacteria bacterium]
MQEVRLGVNVDHVATLRQARGTSYPDPVTAAALAESGGADQITIHLREDRRHIQERDLRILRETVQTRLNLEMAATKEMSKIAYEFKPDMVTLVPEKREELTTEGGLDVAMKRDAIKDMVRFLKDGDIKVSLFIDPDIDQIRAAHKVNADAVELHTGSYCEAKNESIVKQEYGRLVDAAKTCAKIGLPVYAGHGLNLQNLAPVAALKEITEFNIGHSIVGRAIYVGMVEAVREMKAAILRARQGALQE